MAVGGGRRSADNLADRRYGARRWRGSTSMNPEPTQTQNARCEPCYSHASNDRGKPKFPTQIVRSNLCCDHVTRKSSS